MLNLVLISIIFSCTTSLPADEKTAAVDTIFAEWNTTTTPGMALAIIKDGQVIHTRGYGMARIEEGVAITPQTIFDIASTSKQFTAACLAILISRGQVSLNDDIRTFFPQMRQYESPILVKHLVYHTSGLRDYLDLLETEGFCPQSDCPSMDKTLELIFQQEELEHAPGEKYLYTNTGYFLLAQIIERISNQSLNDFASTNIFKPLHMDHTFFRNDHTQIVHNLATGYEPSNDGYKVNIGTWEHTGDGNLYTSVEDLCLWTQALQDGFLTDIISTVGELNNHEKLAYGFGLQIEEYKGLKTIGHEGFWAGYRSACIRFPEQKFTVICLSNSNAQDPTAICYTIADMYLLPRIEIQKLCKVEVSTSLNIFRQP